MKFWQLLSILRSEPRLIHAAAVIKAEWRLFADWTSPEGVSDRSKMDYELPDSFVQAALSKSQLQMFLSDEGQLRSGPMSDDDKSLPALAAFDRFGGDAVEDALEYGSVRVY